MSIERLSRIRTARRAGLSRTLVLTLALGLVLAPGFIPLQAQDALNRVVAVVNNGVIVLSDLQKQLQLVEAQLKRAGSRAPPRRVLERQVLDRLILEHLQLELADGLKIRVLDEELNRAVANVARRNNLSLGEFRRILESDGLNFADFRESIRKEMLLARVQQRQVQSRIRVSEQEVDSWLTSRQAGGGQYRISHILVAVPVAADEETTAEKEKQARAVLARLHAGEDFAEVAAEVSNAPEAVETGGDLGWRASDKLPSIFADVVPELEAGAVSELIRSPSGFHIVKLTEVRGGERSVVLQTRAQHILVRTDEVTTDDDARRRLVQLRERILNGTPLEQLARAHSADRGSAVKDGNLGWLNPGDTVEPFQEAMDALEVGELSEPFKSSFGWHIVKVLERRDFDNSEEIERSNARAEIRRRKVNEELQSWLAQLRDEAYIEYRLEQ